MKKVVKVASVRRKNMKINTSKIKRIMLERGIKIKELSLATKIHETNIVEIFKGESFTTMYLDRFCSYFKMQPAELFSFIDDDEFSDDERAFSEASKKDFSKLKTYLSGRGITTYRLAKDTGITTAELYSVTGGKRNPKWDTVRRILEYLECGLGDICDFV